MNFVYLFAGGRKETDFFPAHSGGRQFFRGGMYRFRVYTWSRAHFLEATVENVYIRARSFSWRLRVKNEN